MLKIPVKITLSPFLIQKWIEVHFIIILQNQNGTMFLLQNLPGTDTYPSTPAGDPPFVTECSAHQVKSREQGIDQAKY